MKRSTKKTTIIWFVLFFFCSFSGYALGQAIAPTGFFNEILPVSFMMLGMWVGIEMGEVIEQKERHKLEIEEIYEHRRTERLKEKSKQEVSDTPCPHCGKMMIVKIGSNQSKFLACPEPETKIYENNPKI